MICIEEGAATAPEAVRAAAARQRATGLESGGGHGWWRRTWWGRAPGAVFDIYREQSGNSHFLVV